MQQKDELCSSKQSKVSKQIEEIIDEKCRFLNKTGTSKGSAIHLAQWMKGQLDTSSQPHINAGAEETNGDDVEHIEDWSPDQLHERSKALQLIDENGAPNGRCRTDTLERRCESRQEDVIATSEVEDETKSASKSTTSDSQITVRSSPITNTHSDKLSVCRHCHKHCKSKKLQHQQSISNSLKVQHSQASSSPIRCCQSAASSDAKSNASSSSEASQTSQLSSQPSTLTGSCTLNVQLISNESNSTVSRSLQSADNAIRPTSVQSSNRIASGGRMCHPQFRPDDHGGVDFESEPTSIESNADLSSSAIALTSMSSSSTSNAAIASSNAAASKKAHQVSGSNESKQSSAADRTCNCSCEPRDFQTQPRQTHELRKETCKLVDNVFDLHRSTAGTSVDISTSISVGSVVNHRNCKCNCGKPGTLTAAVPKNMSTQDATSTITPISITTDDNDDDWSLMLIGLAQLHPATSLVQMDPFKALPSIAVVPPTPEGLFSQFCGSPQWDEQEHPSHNVADVPSGPADKTKPSEMSPEDSPQDEEPPYRSLNASLKRYGTMSSLERFSSEDVEEKTYNSSDDDANDADNVKIITKEIYSNVDSTNWTNRAGTFLEQSRAFLDSYLSRWDRGPEEHGNEDELMDECTSGATSGEDVWGTPTSGENDEMQMFNSDHTNSSPTKSSSSLTGDDDTELMMDELLMAPPMTASSIRGLLPRRRLEPLFEEDTESGESDDEKPAADCSGSDQGQVQKTCTPSGRASAIARPIASAPYWTPRPFSTPISAPAPATVAPVLPPAVTPRRLPAAAAAAAGTTQCPVPPLRIRRTITTELCVAALARNCGSAADTCSTPVPTPGEVSASAANTDRAAGTSTAAAQPAPPPPPPPQPPQPPPRSQAHLQQLRQLQQQQQQQQRTSDTAAKSIETATPAVAPPPTHPETPAAAPPSVVLGLSPRLEMRLALNNDILGDEDLICYDPGPDLASILGHDLSTFHRFTGRDLISRTASRVQPKEACISFSQQRNFKMDTPTLSRRKPSPSTWSSSASVAPAKDKNLSDLERLAKQEMKYCTSQLKNCPAASHPFTNQTTSTSPADPMTAQRHKSKFFSFLSRKNSIENVHYNGRLRTSATSPAICDDHATGVSAATLLRNDHDKSSDRRFWKQLKKRRRSLTVSELSAIAS